MRISFKSFFGETFMALPNLNFWSDDDSDYAPYTRMFFIGWLWWGVRFYYRKAEEKVERFTIKTLHNEYRNEERFVILDEETGQYVTWYDIDLVYDICCFKGPNNEEFHDKSRSGLSELESKAFIAGDTIRVPYKMSFKGMKVACWRRVVDVEAVAAVLERENDARTKDHWKVYNIPCPTHVLSNG